jgi:hypothetical protein
MTDVALTHDEVVERNRKKRGNATARELRTRKTIGGPERREWISQIVSMQLREVGEAFGVSRERARQLEAAALHKLLSPDHLYNVRLRTRRYLRELREAERADASLAELDTRCAEIEDLFGALEWLEMAQDGTFRDHLLALDSAPPGVWDTIALRAPTW